MEASLVSEYSNVNTTYQAKALLMNMQNDKFTIQQVAQATGLSADTLRYYERIGLIHSIDRAENTHRRYSAADISWIKFLNKLRFTGMSIQQMQVYAELQRQGDASLSERLAMLQAHEAKLENHIEALRQRQKEFHIKIGMLQETLAEKDVSLQR